MSTTEERIESWLNGPYASEMKDEIRHLQKDDPKALNDAFFKELTFGTGGMRGVMGVGTNRINIHTIQMATQGLANAILESSTEDPVVFIGYDVRHHSKEFAVEAAKVLAGNKIRALVSSEICPTPLVSFACRYYHCIAAIMITASHNPPQYNGYKVYWEGGGQVVPPHDQKIMSEVAKINTPADVKMAENFEWVGQEIDQAYLKELKKIQLVPKFNKIPLKIIYTNLHGTGIRLVPKGLESWGYTDVEIVPEQSALDGDFPNAASPNPEEDQALELGMKHLKEKQGDLLLATDPDADRIAVAIREGRLTGNEMACICLEHICETLKDKDEFPKNAAVIKSIVTTELFRKIAERQEAKCIDVLTGFKYIAELIGIWEKTFDAYQYLFGAEESYGCLYGTFVRDKDSVSASCLIAEVAAAAKRKNLTLLDKLNEIFRKYGIYKTSLKSLKFKDSEEGMHQMKDLMQKLRQTPLQKVGKRAVAKVNDYLNGFENLPPSNVLLYWLEDGSKLVIRPSGTEPKIKIYSEVTRKSGLDLKKDIALCESEAKELIEELIQELKI